MSNKNVLVRSMLWHMLYGICSFLVSVCEVGFVSSNWGIGMSEKHNVMSSFLSEKKGICWNLVWIFGCAKALLKPIKACVGNRFGFLSLQKLYLVPQLVLTWEKPEQIRVLKLIWYVIKRNTLYI